MTSRSKELWAALTPKHPLQITIRTLKGPDFKFELLPLHSPLLRQSLLVSFPPLIDMLKFSGYPYLIRGRRKSLKEFVRLASGCPRKLHRCCAPGCTGTADGFKGRRHISGAIPNAKLALEGRNDARIGMPRGIPRGAMCVQKLDDSLKSAIHTSYRISLRSSSMPEPRDPLLKVVFIAFAKVESDVTLTKSGFVMSPGAQPIHAGPS
jgi:hypothetical protein